MPNHCFNALIMSETTLPVILGKYIKKNDKDNEYCFDFELIVPIGDTEDWYKQRIENWGTKCVGYDLNISSNSIEFYTAWSPPVPIIQKLAELHKDMVFRLEYYESGMAYRGVSTALWQNGEVLLHDEWWNMTEVDFKELGLL